VGLGAHPLAARHGGDRLDRRIVLLHASRRVLAEARRRRPALAGVSWQVHGGGFYQMSKYLLAPAALPEQLT
jgi:urate oxidase-like protein